MLNLLRNPLAPVRQKAHRAPDVASAAQAAVQHSAPDRIDGRSNGLFARRVAILVADGANALPISVIERALAVNGAQSWIVSPQTGLLTLSCGRSIRIDRSLSNTRSVMFDAVYVPGGAASAATLCKTLDARDFICEAHQHCKTLAASEEGCALLDVGGIRAGLEEAAERDAGVLLLRDAGLRAEQFNAQFVTPFLAALSTHRHWDRQRRSLELI